ncbi:MAG TPA: PepSY-associated TM helix domain-containing protein [Hyphomicrobiales bacterium]|nr:PepSY-associated TM helix domain-containing protein [Hyphomicrobiales bacterium]
MTHTRKKHVWPAPGPKAIAGNDDSQTPRHPMQPARPRRMRGRRLWLTVHLWIALAVGALPALLGLSGAALVLKGPLLRFDFGSATFDVARTPASQWRTGEEWAEQALAHYPDIDRVMGITAPGAGPLPTDAAVITALLRDGGYGFVTVDPATARPLGFFRYGEGWLFTLLDFHRHLLLPEAVEELGETVVACSGLLLLVSIGSGLYLWWPRERGWRHAFTLRRGAAWWRSLHTSVAAGCALPLILLAISGVMLARPDWPGSAQLRSVLGGDATVQTLHAALLLGWPGRILVLAAGLSLPFLYGTGLWLWWRGIRGYRADNRR